MLLWLALLALLLLMLMLLVVLLLLRPWRLGRGALHRGGERLHAERRGLQHALERLRGRRRTAPGRGLRHRAQRLRDQAIRLLDLHAAA